MMSVELTTFFDKQFPHAPLYIGHHFIFCAMGADYVVSNIVIVQFTLLVPDRKQKQTLHPLKCVVSALCNLMASLFWTQRRKT